MKNYDRFYQLSPEQKKEKVEIIKNFLSNEKKILFAFVYGSFNDNPNNLPFHDIDVGIYISGMDQKASFHYAFDLSDQLSGLVHLPVDVRVLNSAPVTFLFHVVRGELIFERDEDVRCNFMEWVVRHYLDMEPLYKRAIKEAYAS